MKLTAEQLDAVRCKDNVILTACPGSGKTCVIVSKLSRTLDEVRNSPRSIACITYTNSAVHEIESRLHHQMQPGDNLYYEIGTIHSFCLSNIFRPFCHLIDGFKNGFSVLTPDSDEFKDHVIQVCAEHDKHNLNCQDFESFANLRISIEGKPAGIAIDRGTLTSAMAIAFWKHIRKFGFVDFATLLYYSYVLLRKRPEILLYVSAKFAWILVDEFQDTTDIQVEILALIAKANQTQFLIVGDPYQSIFGFAGARPDLINVFTDCLRSYSKKQLTGNFRSNPSIVNHANILFPRTPPMHSVGHVKEKSCTPIWKDDNSTFDVVFGEFLPTLDKLGIPLGNAAILAPTWFSLFPLGKKLRERGIRIIGPGARPYRRSRIFAPLAEQVCAYLVEPNPNSIIGIERSLFNLLLSITGRAFFDIFSYDGRVIVFRLIDCARQVYELDSNGIAWLEAVADGFSKILIEREYLNSQEEHLFAMLVNDMKQDMCNNGVDLNKLSIDDLGIYASPNSALRLSSIHNAKGKEFSAVAMIDLHEGRIPHYSAANADDARRQFYVAVTRAKQYLLYITDTSCNDNLPSRFLNELYS